MYLIHLSFEKYSYISQLRHLSQVYAYKFDIHVLYCTMKNDIHVLLSLWRIVMVNIAILIRCNFVMSGHKYRISWQCRLRLGATGVGIPENWGTSGGTGIRSDIMSQSIQWRVLPSAVGIWRSSEGKEAVLTKALETWEYLSLFPIFACFRFQIWVDWVD